MVAGLVITVGFLDQRGGTSQKCAVKSELTLIGWIGNGKVTGVMETHGVIAVAGV